MTTASGSSPNKAFLSTPYKVRNPEEAGAIRYEEFVEGNLKLVELGAYIDEYKRAGGGGTGTLIEYQTSTYVPFTGYEVDVLGGLIRNYLEEDTLPALYFSQYSEEDVDGGIPERVTEPGGFASDYYWIPQYKLTNTRYNGLNANDPFDVVNPLEAQDPSQIPDPPPGNVSPVAKQTWVNGMARPFATNMPGSWTQPVDLTPGVITHVYLGQYPNVFTANMVFRAKAAYTPATALPILMGRVVVYFEIV